MSLDFFTFFLYKMFKYIISQYANITSYSPTFISCHSVPLAHFYMQRNRWPETVPTGTIYISSTIDADEGQRWAGIDHAHVATSHTKADTAPYMWTHFNLYKNTDNTKVLKLLIKYCLK